MTEPKQWAIEQHIKKNPKCEWLCTHTKLENLGEQPEDRPITEPTIDEQIRLKLLSLINNLQDVWLEDKDSWYGAETTVPEILALISDQVAKARIDEVSNALSLTSMDELKARYAELRSTQ